MTPEEIKKEQEASKASKMEKAPVIQPDKANIENKEVNSTELGKMQPVDTTPPKGSARQFAKSVGDYKKVAQLAKEKGVDLDNIGEMPLMASDKGKITDAVKSAYGRELATGIQGISDAITAPQNEERTKLDVKAQMALEKKKRRSAWADALYAFGEGLQGKTANPEAFVSTKIQRKQDEQFQNFKDTTERNQKAKYIFENQSRKELIDWAENESKNMQQNQEYRDKMKMIAEKNAQDQKNKDRGYKIQEDRNNISRNKKPGSTAKEEKEEKLIKVQTAKTTYELKPEEAELYRESVLSNPGKYPGLFDKVQKFQKVNGFDEPIEGEFTYSMKAKYKDVDFVRAYLEENKERSQEITPQNQNAYFDKYRKQKGLPTSDVPVSETTKAGSAPRPQSQPKQAPKADPLGLFSTGGLY